MRGLRQRVIDAKRAAEAEHVGLLAEMSAADIRDGAPIVAEAKLQARLVDALEALLLIPWREGNA